MGKTFVCSLCRNGIIGGGLYIDEQSITYSTQKLTVSMGLFAFQERVHLWKGVTH